ncbi:MAG TPA: hypothetical protein VHE81_08040 [Lacipirellulaceae bacterium]|nr:hypothetical protein [Lacipirellulaceae bacterium]
MLIALIQPVLADIGEVLLGLVAVIFLVIRQILEANHQAGPRQPRVPQVPRPQQPPGNKPPLPQGAGQQADPLRAQVEEFLRRASQPPQQRQQRPGQQMAGPQRPAPPGPQQTVQRPPPPPIQVLVEPMRPIEQRTIGKPLPQAAWRQKQPPAPPGAPQPAAPPGNKRSARTASKRRRQSVAEHVAEQVSARARSLAESASHLGQRIVVEDQQFDTQLKAKFDHTVGTLSGSSLVGGTTPAATEPTPAATETPAAQLASLLANPSGIRQAVLLNEILRRPSERW